MERLICINCNFLKKIYSQWYTKSSSSSTDLYLIPVATSTNFKQIIFSESMLQKYVLKETNDFSFMPSSLSLSQTKQATWLKQKNTGNKFILYFR